MISEKSLSKIIWKEKKIDYNLVESLSQKKSISEIFSKLLVELLCVNFFKIILEFTIFLFNFWGFKIKSLIFFANSK